MFSIAFLICCVISMCDGYSYSSHDFMGWSDKYKVKKLCMILLKDAKLKIRQVTDVVDEHRAMIAFDVGVIIGRIREKYKHMMEVYREAGDRYAGRQTLQGPSLRDFRPVIYIIAMEMVHMREVDIDKLVSMLEHIPPKMLRPKPPKGMKMGSTTKHIKVDRSFAERLEEEDYKSNLREQYAMKKLGINRTGWAWDITSI